ncbi:MAG: GyrI-like domain-containing protein [Syntrophomonadaceae bacterium]|jgi:effector-binding domain-containing protein|nr:GyrI-like domain-containing protein [Syntrophomonadaceae bacterium]MDH7497102.1 GyrI-like domain-containing protein [Syntrophomonadaceae bacterium]
MPEDMPYDIHLEDVPAMAVRSVRRRIRDTQVLGPMIGEALQSLLEAGGLPAGPPMLLFHDEILPAHDLDVEAAWPVSDPALANGRLSAIRAAVVCHTGPYDSLQPVYRALFDWIEAHGLEPTAPIREVYMTDPRTVAPEEAVTVVFVPVVGSSNGQE